MHAVPLLSFSAATPAPTPVPTPAPLFASVAKFARTALLLLPAMVVVASCLGCAPAAGAPAVMFVRQMLEASLKSMESPLSSNSVFVLLLTRVPTVAVLLSALLHQRSVNRSAVRAVVLAAALGISQMLLILAKCATSSTVLALQLSTAK